VPESPSSSAAQAEALVRRWFELIWNQRRLDAIDELASPDGVLHAEGQELRGRAALRRRAAEVHAAFSDIVMKIEDITVHNGVVICRWRATFTHTGPWLGIPPTGKRGVVCASTWIRVEDGWLTEGWDYWEQQLDDVVSQD
jgi:steroid delta-isomerase-like uncharacterized protein